MRDCIKKRIRWQIGYGKLTKLWANWVLVVFGLEEPYLFSTKPAYGGLANLNSSNIWKGKWSWVWKLPVPE
ncbi:hypothetical protein J1N35_033953 [Gossypium stocksii]|uniref:Uncharacterized protein n=1 Tax=Gossypium stocksii TaxID=47602 RepID=A0A9D3URA6_9ROSI|nr:hypothetical protein J1N35_033953 [Gossypium stocksii]